MKNAVIQTTSNPNNWLYQENGEARYFTDFVIRPINSEPWSECTSEEKLAWEEAHKVEEQLEAQEQ